MLDWYEGLIFWGQDWSIQDGMHFQMNGNTFESDRCQDFVDRKIRPDGFSTFRRGDTAPAPVPTFSNAAEVLASATGLSTPDAAAILDGVRTGLVASDATNVKRIAMWLAQMGHESAGWRATEEYASGHAYEGRADLGNVHQGDGPRFKGRSWIQITGRHNYGKLSEWAHWNGLVETPSYFVDHPEELAQTKWAGVGPAWYWTVARSDINELSDRGDLYTVTRRINGGTNGLNDRTERYERALSVGDDLMAILQEQGEGELSASAEKMISEIHGALFNKIASNSIYRDSNEGEWQLHELVKNNDGFAHQDEVEKQALAGNPYELARVVRTARGDGVDQSDWAVARAQRVLVTIEQENPEFLQTFLEGGF
jgi:putative chitinase